MAEKLAFPQIPTTVWWGIRNALNKTPRALIDENFVAAQLGVQQAAARAYISELKRVGILNDESKATDLANEWRLDVSYSSAVDKLINLNYSGLSDLASPITEDRPKMVRWFQQQGLGEGSAKNKAATYILIGSSTPGEYQDLTSKTNKKKQKNIDSSSSNSAIPTKNVQSIPSARDPIPTEAGHKSVKGIDPSININIQIHISSEAGQDQIESIFSAMKKYLYD